MDGAYFSPENAERIARTVRAFESQPPGLNLGPTGLRDRDFSRVRFRNNSGETVPAYGCMRITAIESSDGVEQFVIAKPDTSFNRLYLVNGESDVGTQEVGWGTFLWHADLVLYDDANTPAFGESWGPQNGSWEIKKYRYGFTIWGDPTGGSSDLVMAQQEWVNQIYGKSSGAASKGTGGNTLNVYDGNGSVITSTTVSYTNKGIDIGDDKWMGVQSYAGAWIMDWVECPAT